MGITAESYCISLVILLARLVTVNKSEATRILLVDS